MSAVRPSTKLPDPVVDAILDHVDRYRLTVLGAASRLAELSSAKPREIKSVLAHLTGQSLLAEAPLSHAQPHWHLTTLGATRVGSSQERVGPLSESAKIRAYAILHFCCLSDRPRHRLTSAELEKHFPEIHRPGLPSGYYLDPHGTGCLGLTRVDAGNAGRWDRVVESVREDISSHVCQRGFRDLIQAGRFEIAVLTVFPQKAQRLTQALATHRDTHRVPVRVFAIPDLLPIVTSTPRKEVTR